MRLIGVSLIIRNAFLMEGFEVIRTFSLIESFNYESSLISVVVQDFDIADSHYIVITRLISGKDTAIQVFFLE